MSPFHLFCSALWSSLGRKICCEIITTNEFFSLLTLNNSFSSLQKVIHHNLCDFFPLETYSSLAKFALWKAQWGDIICREGFVIFYTRFFFISNWRNTLVYLDNTAVHCWIHLRMLLPKLFHPIVIILTQWTNLDYEQPVLLTHGPRMDF